MQSMPSSKTFDQPQSITIWSFPKNMCPIPSTSTKTMFRKVSVLDCNFTIAGSKVNSCCLIFFSWGDEVLCFELCSNEYFQHWLEQVKVCFTLPMINYEIKFVVAQNGISLGSLQHYSPPPLARYLSMRPNVLFGSKCRLSAQLLLVLWSKSRFIIFYNYYLLKTAHNYIHFCMYLGGRNDRLFA